MGRRDARALECGARSARLANGQILISLDALSQRIILGTWDTRADWEAWHEDAAYKQTRDRLDELQIEQQETTWHEVLVDVRPSETP